MKFPLVVLLALAGLGAFAGPAAGQEFTDWTSAVTGTASGTLLGHSVTLTGSDVVQAPPSVVDGSSTAFADPFFTPPLATSDEIVFGGFPGYSYTLAFGAPVQDPVLHLRNLASHLTFPAGTQIVRLSGEAGFTVSGNVVSGVLGPQDASGTVRIVGAHESLPFTAEPVFSPATQADEIELQVGGTAPPPPPAAKAENVTRPAIRAVGDGVYTCDPGAWRNATSFTYAWTAFTRGGATRVLSRTQTFTPDSSIYGLPVSCVVTAPGPVAALSPRIFFGPTGINGLPPAYGDVRIRGIDVFQTVQPNKGARMYGYPVSASFETGMCGGGTPTNFRTAGIASACALRGRDPQVVDYDGVTLDVAKPTTAVVYVDVASADAGDPNLAYNLELSASRNGISLGAPVVRTIKNPPRSDTAYVQPFERDGFFNAGTGNRRGIAIELPAAWHATGAPIQLHAELKFPDRLHFPGASFGQRECDRAGCETNDTFTLRHIPFVGFPTLNIISLQLRRISAGQGPLRAPDGILAKGRELYPGGGSIVVQPYRADLDITDATDNTTVVPVPGTSNFQCRWPNGTFGAPSTTWTTRLCRFSSVGFVIQNWVTNNPARNTSNRPRQFGDYDAVFGGHQYSTPGAGVEPGWTVGNIRTVSRDGPATASTTPYFSAQNTGRPLTAAAHELGHLLTAPHASPCNSAGAPEPWIESDPFTTAQTGRLQSTKFTRKVRLGGAVSYQATVDGPYRNGSGTMINPRLYELMSYCASTSDTARDDADSWVSARNWNRYVVELRAMDARKSQRAVAAAARPAATPGSAYAVGVAGGGVAALLRVVPADGDDAIPASVASSPWRLRSLDSRGAVLLDAGVAVQQSSELAGPGAFSGPVAPAAAAVELVRGGKVLDRMERSRAPRVRLTAPRRGTRVRGTRRLSVRWRASDPDRDHLAATVDYSPDGGRSWRTVYDGASTGRAAVPGKLLARSRRARVRVSVSDGFSEATATSRPFVAQGARPQVTIVAPRPGDPLRTGDRVLLSGTAVDDLGATLSGRRLTWYAGRKRLGRGADLRVRLPRSARRLRLVARDRTGRTGVATVRIRVEAPALRLVSLAVPLKVSRGARAMKVRIRVSAAALLRAGGRRYRLRPRRATVSVRLPRRPTVGVVSVPFRLTPRGRGSAGTVRGTFSVARV